jgi:hypothetical protein
MMANFRMNKIIITLLILFSATAYGADVDNTLLQKNLEAANTQIEVLKAQVEVMKSYQDNFLTTVYWSLGGVFSIVILLVGYNWFTNFKNQEKETQYFKDLILTTLNASKKELIGELNVGKNELIAEILKQTNIKIDYENKKIRGDVAKDLDGLKYNLNSYHSESKFISIEVLELQYEKWLAKPNYLLTTSIAVKLIEKAHSLKQNYRVTLYLEFLVTSLKSLKSSLHTLSVDKISIVTKCIKNLEDEHEATCNLIKKLLNEITEKT